MREDKTGAARSSHPRTTAPALLGRSVFVQPTLEFRLGERTAIMDPAQGIFNCDL
jgi:hypothetical protein